MLARQFGAGLAGLRVLDMGCGGGFLAEEFAALGCRVTRGRPVAGVDRRGARPRGRARLAHRLPGRAGEELPAPDAAFDVACCCDVLEHVSDVDRVMSETARVLEPGGLYLFDTVDRTRASKLLAVKAVQQWPLTRLTDVAFHDWDMFIKPAELAAILERHGLTPGKTTGLGARATPLAVLRSLASARLGANHLWGAQPTTGRGTGQQHSHLLHGVRHKTAVRRGCTR